MRPLPPGVLAFADRGEDWASWVDALPGLADRVVAEWELSADGALLHGVTALVVPVRTAGGRPAVLKLGFPDVESEHEHLALQHWHGRGAVQLLRADPVEACETVAALYADLHVPAPPQLRRLSGLVPAWDRLLAALPRNAPVPHRLVDQARSLARDLAADDATDGTLVHTDLHYANVLAADRAPWLVIDPKPLSGDPHYEPAPLLWNRWDEVTASGDVRGSVRARFHAVVDTAGLDEARARAWAVLRMVVNAAESADREWVTRCVTIAKAVQD